MEKYSGGYVPVNPNFIISNIKKQSTIDEELLGVLAVAQNILFRGVPTKPSVYLSSILGEIKSQDFKYTYGTQKNEWKNVIRVGTKEAHAWDIYDHLHEIEPRLASLALPECIFGDIILEDRKSKEQADFYFPSHRVEVEVDGRPHLKTAKQDAIRDSRLYNAGVVYVNRSAAENISKDLHATVSLIVDKLKEQNISNFIAAPSKKEKLYMLVFRFQILLLELLKNGTLKLNAENFTLSIHSNESRETVEAAFSYAYEDLKLWLLNLFALLNKEISFPTITLTDDSACIVDVDIYNRYDQNDILIRDDVIRIRNDYFLYTRNPYCNETTYCQCKNYYSVAQSPLRFNQADKENEAHLRALSFFLKNLFFGGNAQFRENQIDIITAGLNHESSVIGLLPTGSGKSVCYQLIGMLTPGVSLVVSPLKLLMRDQCENLAKRSLITTAIYINSDNYADTALFENNHAKFVYIAPERFLTESFQKIFPKQAKHISHVVVDEVHCLSEWGHDFRTAYLLLLSFVKKNIPTDKLLLTGTSATASPHVITDIKVEFGKIKVLEPVVIRSNSVKRPELVFCVEDCKKDKTEHLIKAIKQNAQNKGKTLIFSPTITGVKDICKTFDANSINSYGSFTGKSQDLEEQEKDEQRKAQDFRRFKNGESLTMVATKAFGMGVDIVDIRNTIHYGVSSSVESMYQEVGRAGRDRKRSTCTFLIKRDEKTYALIKKLLSSENDEQFVKDLSSIRKTALYGDLDTQLYFLQQSNCDPQIFSEFICKTYSFIKSNSKFSAKEAFDALNTEVNLQQTRLFFKKTKKKEDKSVQMLNSSNEEVLVPNYQNFVQFFDKALYKLYTLGVIELWNVQYKEKPENKFYTNIAIRQITAEECIANLETYVNKYENFQFQRPAEGRMFSLIVKALCEWDNGHFLKYRKDSLRNMYEFLYDFKSSEDFAERIEHYFVDNPEVLKTIQDRNKFNVDSVFDCLKTDPGILRDQLRRHREGMRDNLSLNFMFGMASIKVKDFSSENQAILKRALDQIINTKITADDTARAKAETVLERSLDYFKDEKKGLVLFLKIIRTNYKNLLNNLPSQKIRKNLKSIEEYIKYEQIKSALLDLKKSLGELYE